MNATTHAVFGVAALAGYSLLTGEAPPLYAYPAAVISSWIPDVDNPRSRLGNGLSRMKNPALNSLTRPVSWTLRVVSFTLFRTVGHRTLTHSLLGVAVFVALVSPGAAFSPDLFTALVAGYVSHLVADKVEPGREGPNVEDLRELACKDLRRSACAALEASISHNENRGRPVHPKSLETLKWLEDSGEGGV